MEKIYKKLKIGKKKKAKGFIILIAIVVSSLLVSLGMFIANTAYKELMLSISGKASQTAFFVADSVMECALRHDIRGAGFKRNHNYNHYAGGADSRGPENLKMKCNGVDFEPALFGLRNGNVMSRYFISFAVDTDGSGELEDIEINAQPAKAYAKLEVTKNFIGVGGDETIIEVHARNMHTGINLVERSIRVTY